MSAASAVRGSALCPSFPKALCPSFPRSLTCNSLCTLADMPLDGCAPGAAGPGDDSPVVWGRVRSFSPLAHDTLPAVAPCHSQGLLCCAHAVFALLPPDVHHDMAAQQKHMPNLPPKVGVCICTQAGTGDAWDSPCRRICSSRSGRTRRRLSFMGRDLSAGPLSGVALMSSARAGERCRDSPMRRSLLIIIKLAVPAMRGTRTYDTTSRVCCIVYPGRPSRLPGAARTAVPGYPRTRARPRRCCLAGSKTGPRRARAGRSADRPAHRALVRDKPEK